jgi:hypothetical protein
MKAVGWEIRPLGWILLIVIVVTVSYFVIKRFRHRSPEQKGNA